MTREQLALIAAAGSGVVVGAATVATGSIVGDIGPVTIAFVRYFIGVLLLLPLALRITWIRVTPRAMVGIVLFGVFQFAVLIILLNFSVIYIAAGLAVLIFASLPLLTMAIAILLGREAFTYRKIIGILLTLVGVGFAVGASAFTGEINAAGWLGIGAAFSSALVGALCSVLFSAYMPRYPTLQISTMAMGSAVVFLFGLAIMEGMIDAISGFSMNTWFILLFIGFSSAVGYFCWLFALSHIPASNVTVFLGLSPVVAAILGAIFIAQPLSFEDLAGAGLVITGLVISLWRRESS
ncbi:DMT family transporter [uncultured Sneathiella sp.]|jgi:drug/metabolite transporter (DMT)-like permease|uniref:DMT family transporter n=1 Tax=uncultured Sneathiella sp. TaxID=879315 RepID=UPI0030DCDE39|tara:strand:+ start:5942 stop:6826 length:885 start_codon:yes stop_codon:yes gene_type:complete